MCSSDLMPGLDGFETCRRLKADLATRPIPVVFMTGLTDSDHVVRGFQAGGIDYVTKPIRTAEVIARIASHLRNARLVADTQAASDAAGDAIVAIDDVGRVSWATPLARSWLNGICAADHRLPEALLRAGMALDDQHLIRSGLDALEWICEVQTAPTSMSFAVSIGDGQYEWKGSDQVMSVFAQWTNLFNVGHIRMLLEILKLNSKCNALLKAGTLPSGSLGEFLDAQGFSQALRRDYLLPMAGMIWSCSPKAAAEYPADDFMRFFDSHSLFTATQQPTWHSVTGGSNTYVKKTSSIFAIIIINNNSNIVGCLSDRKSVV